MYLPERLHDVRIAVKKLRYAVELGADASGARREPDLRALKRGQEMLGRMHDLQMLIDRVRRRAGVAHAAQPRASGATSTPSSRRSTTTAAGCTRATCAARGRAARDRRARHARGPQSPRSCAHGRVA